MQQHPHPSSAPHPPSFPASNLQNVLWGIGARANRRLRCVSFGGKRLADVLPAEVAEVRLSRMRALVSHLRDKISTDQRRVYQMQ